MDNNDMGSSNAVLDKQGLLHNIEAGWQRLQAFVDSYSEEQLTQPTDAAGWTAKDHLMHLAVWQGSMIDVMDKKPRWECMNVPKDVWATLDTGSYDEVNAHIQQQHKNLNLAEVRAELQQRADAFVKRIEEMPAEDLQRPYKDFNPYASNETEPLIEYLKGNSYDHYDEHMPWMRAVIESQP
jgi:hypothetical protein